MDRRGAGRHDRAGSGAEAHRRGPRPPPGHIRHFAGRHHNHRFHQPFGGRERALASDLGGGGGTERGRPDGPIRRMASWIDGPAQGRGMAHRPRLEGREHHQRGDRHEAVRRRAGHPAGICRPHPRPRRGDHRSGEHHHRHHRPQKAGARPGRSKVPGGAVRRPADARHQQLQHRGHGIPAAGRGEVPAQ